MTTPNSSATAANEGVDDALPPPEEIVAGSGRRGALYRLRTPMSSTALPWVMPYAFAPATAEGVTLFDAGYGTPDATEAMTAQLAALGRKPADVRRLIVSHFHPDHIGMAGWLKEENPDLELVMHGNDAAIYSGMDRGHDAWESTMRTWGIRHGFDPDELDQANEERHERRQREKAEARAQTAEHDTAKVTEQRQWEMKRVQPSRLVEDGEEITFDGWTLVSQWTPGHTPGHLCITIPDERLTFTGDHVLSRITPNVSYHPEDEESGRNPLEEFLASLQKTADLDTRLALPAHEELIEDLPARCRFIIDHHHERADEVIEGITSVGSSASGADGATAFEIASRVTWNRPWETFSIWKQRSAIGETLAHLRLVETQGRVRRVEGQSGDHAVVRWLPV